MYPACSTAIRNWRLTFGPLRRKPSISAALVRQRVRDCSRQLKYDQLLTWPTDQPRHATSASSYPVESSSPPREVLPNRNLLSLSTFYAKDLRRASGKRA